MCLPIASKAIAPLLWLLASESKDGVFEADFAELSFRLRVTECEISAGLNPLITKGFFLDASTMLAPCLQVAIPETERERETEKNSLSTSQLTFPVDQLIDLYESELPTMSVVRRSLFKQGKNIKQLKARWDWVMNAEHEKGPKKGNRLAETEEQGIDWFKRFFGYVSESEFLTGRQGSWKGCNLAWLITVSNFENVLSGKYHEKK